METLLDILKYILPSLVIVLVLWLLLNQFSKAFKLPFEQERARSDGKQVLKMRLQAYERLSVFLERITLDSLLIRENRPELSARQFHQHLVDSIRSEFDHNLSQQIYLSHDAW